MKKANCVPVGKQLKIFSNIFFKHSIKCVEEDDVQCWEFDFSLFVLQLKITLLGYSVKHAKKRKMPNVQLLE